VASKAFQYDAGDSNSDLPESNEMFVHASQKCDIFEDAVTI
jgi:hypothetical protein